MESVKIKIEIECPPEELRRIGITKSVMDFISESQQKREDSRTVEYMAPPVKRKYPRFAVTPTTKGACVLMQALEENAEPMTRRELAAKSGYNECYCGEILRVLKRAGMIEEEHRFGNTPGLLYYYRLVSDKKKQKTASVNKTPTEHQSEEDNKLPKLPGSNRGRIMTLLGKINRPMTASELIRRGGFAYSTLFNGLAVLRNKGLVEGKKVFGVGYYSLTPEGKHLLSLHA